MNYILSNSLHLFLGCGLLLKNLHNSSVGFHLLRTIAARLGDVILSVRLLFTIFASPFIIWPPYTLLLLTSFCDDICFCTSPLVFPNSVVVLHLKPPLLIIIIILSTSLLGSISGIFPLAKKETIEFSSDRLMIASSRCNSPSVLMLLVLVFR